MRRAVLLTACALREREAALSMASSRSGIGTGSSGRGRSAAATVISFVALDTTLGEEDEFGLYEGYFDARGSVVSAVRAMLGSGLAPPSRHAAQYHAWLCCMALRAHLRPC